ncbi:Uncharacterised protein [Mycobacteroides abscessus subsp. abscessus]|uniref:hypothetical protein n=1 Tax=Mycobacteroides abscessus TaxID=36809 RepID=UPI00092A47D3|nr:hypothetical protein [Mycobacteroides abscessus]SHR99311.1 Uncharacterised protein [Mycobacteroides abscessus subsp. abscessus]
MDDTTVNMSIPLTDCAAESRVFADEWEEKGDAVGATAMRVSAESTQQLQGATSNGTPEDLVSARQRAALKVLAPLGLTRDELFAVVSLAGERTTAELKGLDYEKVSAALVNCARYRCGDDVPAALTVMSLLEVMWPDVVMEVSAEVRRYAPARMSVDTLVTT